MAARTTRRTYTFCAKCGNEKPENTSYVCDVCKYTGGLFKFCAVCGKPLFDVGQPGRSYVHADCSQHVLRRGGAA